MIGQEIANIGAVSEEIILCDIEIHKLKAQIEGLQKKRDELNAFIVREIANGSTFKEISYHNRTLYIATVRRPKPARSRPELVEALKSAGLNRMVKEDYNENTLWGYTNEIIAPYLASLTDLEARTFDANTVIPDNLRDDLSLTARYEIRVTK